VIDVFGRTAYSSTVGLMHNRQNRMVLHAQFQRQAFARQTPMVRE
jgi:hypothetical protein